MNHEVDENRGLNPVEAANREFAEACYIRATQRGLHVDARMFPPCCTF
jgi:hypothetical protein